MRSEVSIDEVFRQFKDSWGDIVKAMSQFAFLPATVTSLKPIRRMHKQRRLYPRNYRARSKR